MRQITRRTFLRNTLATAASVTIAGTKSSGRVLGANDAIRVGVAGIHGQGNGHIEQYVGLKGVQITYLIDPDSRLFASRSAPIKEKWGRPPTCVQDIRKALEDKELDAVSIATPNHWHSLMTIWACQAGKHVYVEKPLSHDILEGRRCIEAARKYNRIVQHGTQNRSSTSRANEIAAVQSGKYGKLLVSKGYCCKQRWSIGRKEVSKPPEKLDFNLWLGPAAERPFHANLVHYNWHWFWDFGNGDIGNQGVHEMDIARWALGASLPKSVVSLGGRYVDEPNLKDQGETPNQLVSVFDYGDALLLFEPRGLVDNAKVPEIKKNYPNKVANELYFEAGVVKDGKFFPGGKGGGEPLVKVDYHAPSGGHFGNFINCVRNRKREELAADIQEGHLSSALCHLGNISYRLAKERRFEKPKDFSDNEVVG